MVPAGNKAKCLSSVNHTTNTIQLNCSSWLVNPWSHINQGLGYTGLDQSIDSSTKSRTKDTLFLTSVTILLQQEGVVTHCSRLVYQESYKMQDFQDNGLDRHIDSPTIEQDQWFVGLKTAKIGQQDYRHNTQNYWYTHQGYRFLGPSHVGMSIYIHLLLAV